MLYVPCLHHYFDKKYTKRKLLNIIITSLKGLTCNKISSVLEKVSLTKMCSENQLVDLWPRIYQNK